MAAVADATAKRRKTAGFVVVVSKGAKWQREVDKHAIVFFPLVVIAALCRNAVVQRFPVVAIADGILLSIGIAAPVSFPTARKIKRTVVFAAPAQRLVNIELKLIAQALVVT